MEAGYIVAIILGVITLVLSLIAAWQKSWEKMVTFLLVFALFGSVSLVNGARSATDNAKAEQVFQSQLSGKLMEYDTGRISWSVVYTYLDKDKFPTGPWCKVGDWILMRSYSGTRFKIKGQEFRILNDDTVQAVIADPRLIERA